MHHRANSRSKWMDVLGFDLEESSGSNHSRVSSSSTYSLSSSSEESQSRLVNQPSPLSPCPATYPRFPRDITFFRSHGDILLSPSSPAPSSNDLKPLPAPPQLFHITIQRDPEISLLTARPDLMLHSGPSNASPIISFAKFHSVTQATDLTLCPAPPKSISANFSTINFSRPTSPIAERSPSRLKFEFEQLVPTGSIFGGEKHEFSHTLPRSGKREKFEWRHANGPFVRTFEKDNTALKLVRVRTGDVVAVYAGLGQTSKASNPNRVLGMFRFLKGKGAMELGEEFEVLTVITVLSLVERQARVAKAHRKAFGVR